ncbi:MAG: hypothetical protein CM15mP12_0630 [Gammaproteobacteria bacterium]|nr:MAG: hypothetical protein CM15mP12_0630 [Gammaproteobacteria bacterium]
MVGKPWVEGFNHFHRLWFGIVYFVPIYLTVFIVGIACEAIFATIRRHEINEGAFFPQFFFCCCFPQNSSMGGSNGEIYFGIVVGKEFLGAKGKNFLNPLQREDIFLLCLP